MDMNDTPRGNRLHIGIYGKRNAGKSALINAITGQSISLVSDIAGTTTDPVYKSMELHGLGPVVFIDTAGLDDEGKLGSMRVSKTKGAVLKTDIAIVVFTKEPDIEMSWINDFKKRSVPVIAVLNKVDRLENIETVRDSIKRAAGLDAIEVSASKGQNIDELRARIVELVPENFWDVSITGCLAEENDTVLLVMPQDIEAPKGRLILPQVQTIRELLDKKCVIISVTSDKIDEALAALAHPPKLIITDSQVFPKVYAKKPDKSMLTSFSVLFAANKGDIHAFLKGAEAIGRLTERSHVLIAEACAHAPVEEDIGRIKIPMMLRKRVGEALSIDFVRGVDFPSDLRKYDLIIHCAACVFNRKQMMSRVSEAERQGVPSATTVSRSPISRASSIRSVCRATTLGCRRPGRRPDLRQ